MPAPLLLAESFLHRIDPFVVRISGDFGIRWYGLAYLAGFVIGWLLLRWMARTGRSLLTQVQVGDFVTAMVIGVLVGGRVGHALFYEPHLFWTFTSSPPWWELLALHHGGMSSHGGILGVLVACIWSARRLGVSTWHLLDLVAFACPIGLGLGRVANFINGELWGRSLPESMRGDPPWWSVKYPEEILLPGFDAARLAPVANLVSPDRPLPEAVYEALRLGRAEVIERVVPMLTPYWPSQLFQAITDGLLLPALLVAVWLHPRKPGIVAGSFLVGYGALRFATEQFRAPDEGVLWIGVLTLPMALSLAMIVAGIALLVLRSRAPVDRLGGLLRPRAA